MEGFYAPDRNPVIEALCRDAMRAFRTAIPRLVANPTDRDARGEALFAAWCCSTTLGQVTICARAA